MMANNMDDGSLVEQFSCCTAERVGRRLVRLRPREIPILSADNAPASARIGADQSRFAARHRTTLQFDATNKRWHRRRRKCARVWCGNGWCDCQDRVL